MLREGRVGAKAEVKFYYAAEEVYTKGLSPRG